MDGGRRGPKVASSDVSSDASKTEAPQSTNAISPGATPVAESVKASNNSIRGNDPIVNTENGTQTAQSGRITVDELMEGIGDKPKTVPAQSRQGADSGINISDLLDETVAKQNGAPADPVAAAVEGFRSTGTVTNKQAQDILNSARAVTQLMKEADLKIYGLSASQQRTAVKEAVAKLANANVDTTAGTDYDNSNITGGVNYGAGETGTQDKVFNRTDGRDAEGYGGVRPEDGNRSGIQSPGGRGTETLGRDSGVRPEEITALFRTDEVYTPTDGTPLREVQNRFETEYGISCRVVKASAWNMKAPAFIHKGTVYISEEIDADSLKQLVPHESTHGMKQGRFEPYLDFVRKTPGFVKFESVQAQDILARTAAHVGVDLKSKNEADIMRIYDELNAAMFGAYESGALVDDNRAFAEAAFPDLDGYLAELSGIHEQFKQEQKSKGTPAADESVGAAPSGFDPISHLQYEYGTIPEGENAVRDDSLPVSTASFLAYFLLAFHC